MTHQQSCGCECFTLRSILVVVSRARSLHVNEIIFFIEVSDVDFVRLGLF